MGQNTGNLHFLITLQDIVHEGSLNEQSRGNYADGQSVFTKEVFHVYETYEPDDVMISNIRKLAWKSSIGEILWIYRDTSNDLTLLKEKYGVGWWESWDIGDGTIGQTYGKIVEDYDLMNKLLKGLEEKPFDRRHILDLWQYSHLSGDKGAYGLPPCAFMSVYSVEKVGDEFLLHAELHQRSSDFITANVINKVQYHALQKMIVGHLRTVTGLNYKVGKFSHVVTNVHIYDRHFKLADQILEEFSERLNTKERKMPELILKDDKLFHDYELSDFELINFIPLFDDMERPEISI